jgi:hypothetical protein
LKECAMTMRRYAIVRDGAQWKIVGGGAAASHFPSCAAAAFASARLAVKAADDGDEVEVLVQERFGQLRSVTPDLAAYQNAQWPDRPRRQRPASLWNHRRAARVKARSEKRSQDARAGSQASPGPVGRPGAFWA